MSLSQVNSMLMMAKPNDAVPRIRSNPGTPATAASIGMSTKRSTSSAAKPSASANMVTVGLLIFGKISTFIVARDQIPATITTPAINNTAHPCLNDQKIILSNIVVDSMLMPHRIITMRTLLLGDLILGWFHVLQIHAADQPVDNFSHIAITLLQPFSNFDSIS